MDCPRHDYWAPEVQQGRLRSLCTDFLEPRLRCPCVAPTAHNESWWECDDRTTRLGFDNAPKCRSLVTTTCFPQQVDINARQNPVCCWEDVFCYWEDVSHSDLQEASGFGPSIFSLVPLFTIGSSDWWLSLHRKGEGTVPCATSQSFKAHPSAATVRVQVCNTLVARHHCCNNYLRSIGTQTSLDWKHASCVSLITWASRAQLEWAQSSYRCAWSKIYRQCCDVKVPSIVFLFVLMVVTISICLYARHSLICLSFPCNRYLNLLQHCADLSVRSIVFGRQSIVDLALVCPQPLVGLLESSVLTSFWRLSKIAVALSIVCARGDIGLTLELRLLLIRCYNLFVRSDVSFRRSVLQDHHTPRRSGPGSAARGLHELFHCALSNTMLNHCNHLSLLAVRGAHQLHYHVRVVWHHLCQNTCALSDTE